MTINNQFYKDTFGWGFVLWLFGYILGIILFMFVPVYTIGWFLTPIATIFTVWVLIKQIKSTSLAYYFVIGIIWTILAVVLDYFLLVKVFNPPDGYYKLDVYIYYGLTFLLPVIIGWRKEQKARA